jgi:DNA transformation protein and related proteins
MSANTEFVAFVSDLLAPMGPLAAGRFFGGHAFKSGDVQFAMIMGNTLYLRVDDKTRALFEQKGSEPFSYGKTSRRVTVKTYYAAPEELLDEPDELVVWARRALDAATRSPTGSRPRKRK